ncbi:helix-turn-helix domain-containing protein [Candidatus Arsenophonus triatominarum]|uniref:helix-turn-helix domain-containing protein n=1 Tax=Candidatus Arsenophonus triatominarum TaxID=57911 RepID=UPI0007C44B62|nr:helix-turn-helix domain-containing protein [Candidatus Arsenophonus triatominarum]
MNKKKPLTKEQLDDAERLKSLYVLKKNELRITQDDIADQLGIGQAAVSHYLNGINPLNTKTVVAFAKILKVKPSEISPSISFEIEEIAKLLIENDNQLSVAVKKDNSNNQLTKRQQELIDMFESLPEKEQNRFLQEIRNRTNEIYQLVKEINEKQKKRKMSPRLQ